MRIPQFLFVISFQAVMAVSKVSNELSRMPQHETIFTEVHTPGIKENENALA